MGSTETRECTTSEEGQVDPRTADEWLNYIEAKVSSSKADVSGHCRPIKIILDGEDHSGRTSLITALTRGKLSSGGTVDEVRVSLVKLPLLSGFGSYKYLKSPSIPATLAYSLILTDTSYACQYSRVLPSYYRWAHFSFRCIRLDKEVTEREVSGACSSSFHADHEIYPKIPYILVGTKSDLKTEGTVSAEQLTLWAKKHGALGYFECSAKDPSSVHQLFVVGALCAILYFPTTNALWEAKRQREEEESRKHAEWLQTKDGKLSTFATSCGLSATHLANVYSFGSRVYSPNPSPDADFDFVVIGYDAPYAKMQDNLQWLLSRGWIPPLQNLIQGQNHKFLMTTALQGPPCDFFVFSPETFNALLLAWVPFAVEIASQPSTSIWKGSPPPSLPQVDPSVVVPSFLFSANYLQEKSRFLLELGYAGGAHATKQIYLGKKKLVHAVRTLMFGLQVLEHGKIVDFTVAQPLYEQVMSLQPGSVESVLYLVMGEFSSLSIQLQRKYSSSISDAPGSKIVPLPSELKESYSMLGVSLPTATVVGILCLLSPWDISALACSSRDTFITVHCHALIKLICSARGYRPVTDVKKWVGRPYRWFSGPDEDLSDLPLMSPISLYIAHHKLEVLKPYSTKCFHCKKDRLDLDNNIMIAYSRCWAILNLMDFQKYRPNFDLKRGTFYRFNLLPELSKHTIVWCCECTTQNSISRCSNYGEPGIKVWCTLTPEGNKIAQGLITAANQPQASALCYYCHSDTSVSVHRATCLTIPIVKEAGDPFCHKSLVENTLCCVNGHIFSGTS
ncbi:hypothetical protein Pelo_8058 [Pelomyxa schiedti]|nr:hypothetical protein Pelo_8058 [Pelomyxa schiedti]